VKKFLVNYTTSVEATKNELFFLYFYFVHSYQFGSFFSLLFSAFFWLYVLCLVENQCFMWMDGEEKLVKFVFG